MSEGDEQLNDGVGETQRTRKRWSVTLSNRVYTDGDRKERKRRMKRRLRQIRTCFMVRSASEDVKGAPSLAQSA